MKWRALVVVAALGIITFVAAQPQGTDRPDIEFFIANMVERHGMDAAVLRDLLLPLKPIPSIVKAVTTPTTGRPWSEYRALFLDKGRIDGGVKFWNDNQVALARAHEIYRVPESIIVAILGVETRYGKTAGNYRILDALYTLGFEVPGRNEYFKSELEAFLLLTREQGWDPSAVKGSYAGAMGMPQFMPSSYRKYAVDFNENGKINLWMETADVIGSVANFLNYFGWRASEPIAVPMRYEGADLVGLLAMGIKPHTTVQQLKTLGVVPQSDVDEQLLASVFTLETREEVEYWLCFNNLNAILQYNRSRNYAMSVYQLALEIARERQRLAAIDMSPRSRIR